LKRRRGSREDHQTARKSKHSTPPKKGREALMPNAKKSRAMGTTRSRGKPEEGKPCRGPHRLCPSLWWLGQLGHIITLPAGNMLSKATP